jgi:hypothetical protein
MLEKLAAAGFSELGSGTTEPLEWKRLFLHIFDSKKESRDKPAHLQEHRGRRSVLGIEALPPGEEGTAKRRMRIDRFHDTSP